MSEQPALVPEGQPAAEEADRRAVAERIGAGCGCQAKAVSLRRI